jgi:hypothetical protein
MVSMPKKGGSELPASTRRSAVTHRCGSGASLGYRMVGKVAIMQTD